MTRLWVFGGGAAWAPTFDGFEKGTVQRKWHGERWFGEQRRIY